MVLYARYAGPYIETAIENESGFQEVNEDEETQKSPISNEELPSLFYSILPILLPIALILLSTVINALGHTYPHMGYEKTLWGQSLLFLGNPVIAVALGVLAAVYGLVPRMSQQETLKNLEKGVESAGIILLVTGAGGALGAVLNESGGGDYIGNIIASWPMPAFLIPFFISSFVRLIQGSGTVAMITGASISAPIIQNIPGVNLILAAQAACLGGLFFSYFSDSFFWVVNRLLGVTNAKHQMLVWSIPTLIGWLMSLICLFIAHFVMSLL